MTMFSKLFDEALKSFFNAVEIDNESEKVELDKRARCNDKCDDKKEAEKCDDKCENEGERCYTIFDAIDDCMKSAMETFGKAVDKFEKSAAMPLDDILSGKFMEDEEDDEDCKEDVACYDDCDGDCDHCELFDFDDETPDKEDVDINEVCDNCTFDNINKRKDIDNTIGLIDVQNYKFDDKLSIAENLRRHYLGHNEPKAQLEKVKEIILDNLKPVECGGCVTQNGDLYEMVCMDKTVQSYLKEYKTLPLMSELEKATGFSTIWVISTSDEPAKIIFRE